MLPMLMIRAGSSSVPAASSSGRNALVRKNGVFRLRSTTLSQAAAGYSASGAPQVAPALLTRTLTARSRSPTSAASRRHSRSADRSAGMAWTAPYADSSFAASAQASALRELMYTRAPACSRPRAIMSPMPRLPPVTTAVFPDRSNRSMAAPARNLSGGRPRRWPEAYASAAPDRQGLVPPRRSRSGWPGAGRVLLARHVGGQPGQQCRQAVQVGVGEPVPQLAIEGGRGRRHLDERGLTGRGQFHHVDAPVGRIPGPGDQALRVHGIEVVGEGGLPHSHRLGQ